MNHKEKDLKTACYVAVIMDRKVSAESLARRLNLPPTTVYGWLSDERVRVPTYAAQEIFLLTQDPRVKRALEPEGWILARRPAAHVDAATVEREGNDVIMALSAALAEVRQDLADGRMHEDHAACLDALMEEVMEFRSAVQQAKANGNRKGGSHEK